MIGPKFDYNKVSSNRHWKQHRKKIIGIFLFHAKQQSVPTANGIWIKFKSNVQPLINLNVVMSINLLLYIHVCVHVCTICSFFAFLFHSFIFSETRHFDNLDRYEYNWKKFKLIEYYTARFVMCRYRHFGLIWNECRWYSSTELQIMVDI